MDNYQIAIASNIAANARAFCLSMVAINLLAGSLFLAMTATISIGLAVIADMLIGAPARPFISSAAILLAIGSFILTVIVTWGI